LGGRESGWGNILSYYSDVEGPGDFIAEDDGLGDKGTGNNTSVDVETHLVAFLENLVTIPQLQKYEDFWRIGLQIKGIIL
jgi:hypothetical protein